MGRTERKRKQKRSHQGQEFLDHEESIINLKKFMARNGFNDKINLKLREFTNTGRGISAMKNVQENEVLIRLPLNLLITYATVESSEFIRCFSGKLTMHDLLACFLVWERHKKSSFWGDYINSLPSTPWLPALLSGEQVELLPADLRLAAKKSRRLLEESWSRVKRSIKAWCFCCGEKASCVINLHSFTWGFILVNTRAVYIDPGAVRELCDFSADILSDEPCMALCPFLDMFNHSYEAGTKAELVRIDGKLVYQLTTLTKYKKYEQVFISYGDHDNVKLLMEYGFFIPGNVYDFIPIQGPEVFKALELKLNDCQYKFIKKHLLDQDLNVSTKGPSFNLKALLFVAYSAFNAENLKNICSVIYADKYPLEFLNFFLPQACRKILSCYLENSETSTAQISSFVANELLDDFLKYRKRLTSTFSDML